MEEKRPDLFMIGGANGAGKTTAALLLLPRFLDTFEFVNADEIARGLNPLKPETADVMAGRTMIERIENLTAARISFAFETTCARRHHARTLDQCAQAGYRLHLIFLWLPSAEMAIHRVGQRVRQGGHAIPKDTIRRRYAAGLRNMLELYLPKVDTADIVDNSGQDSETHCYRVIAQKKNGDLTVHDRIVWRQIVEGNREVSHG